MTGEAWEGAGLREVARRALLPFAEGGRVLAEGPQVRLGPRATLALSMALHELATNAAKHGALSAPGGRVRLGWSLEPPGLRLLWQESGGPPVAAPRRRGFGTRLIERGLGGELGGRAAIEFRPEGVVCRIEAAVESGEAA